MGSGLLSNCFRPFEIRVTFRDQAMQTVDKAMTLLGFFTPSEPEIGLSDLARLAGFDKAATRRFLVALSKHGLIEQNPANKRYRLGSAFLRLARIREATVPLGSIMRPVLDRMAEQTGETAHASILSGDSLMTIGIAEPQRVTRVYIDPAQLLPLHATASGLACLAFSGAEQIDGYFARVSLKRHTGHTVTAQRTIRTMLSEIRDRGVARAERSFENDVIGTAAPYFDAAARPAGAVAVAAIDTRFSKEAARLIASQVIEAAAHVTRATGGVLHPEFVAASSNVRRK